MNIRETRKTAILVDGGYYRKRAIVYGGKQEPLLNAQMNYLGTAYFIYQSQMNLAIYIEYFIMTAPNDT